MSDDDMHTRMSRLEWRQDALEDSHKRQEDRMTALSERIDVHHREVMEAITSLRDDRAKNLGATEARQRMVKWIGVALAAVGTLLALIGFNSSEAAWLPVDVATGPPIPVQYYAREVP